MKKYFILFSAILLLCIVTSCNQKDNSSSTLSNSSNNHTQNSNMENQESSKDAADAKLREQYGDIFSLSTKQRLEDYQYLWDTLKDSYLYWGVIKREGTDIDAIYENYLESIKQDGNDVDFYIALNSMLYRLGQNGHLGMIEPGQYEDYRNTYADIKERSYWNKVLNNKLTQKNYPKFGEMLNAMDALDADETQEVEPETSSNKNITSFLIPGGEIAYLKINSFDMNRYEEDKKTIFQFYDSIRDCNYLIIDISSNSGGGDRYWMDLLVAPHIQAPLSSDNYALVARSKNNAPYLEQGLGDEQLHPIDELDQQLKIDDTDKKMATHYFISNRTVTPSSYQSPFHGNIMVLTSERVYSSSEAFSVFCKNTGFAKLAGNRTGGDGIGIDPGYVVLPNSGIIVRYSIIFGLNKDGSCNEEFGTTPDYPSTEDEVSLATALKVIEEEFRP